MSWKELGKPKDIELTPQRAAKYLEANEFPHQRPLDRQWVRNLFDIYKEGMLRRVDIRCALDEQTGNVYLVDGQHSCQLATDFNVTIPACVRDYECSDLASVGLLYSTFNTDKARSQTDVIRAGLDGLPEVLRSYPLAFLNRSATALSYLSTNRIGPPIMGRRESKGQRLIRMAASSDELIRIRDLWTTASNGMLTVPVLTAIYACFRVDHDAAVRFWKPALDRVGIDNPNIAAISKYLVEGERSAGVRVGGGPAATAQWAKCVTWWNTWRKNGKRGSVKVAAMKELPVPI